jgi:hypothetical protein
MSSSVLLARARGLPLCAHRGRSSDLRARIHHHFQVLASGFASPVGHPDTRVARRAERAGRGGQRHCLPRTGRHGAPATAHGPAVVDWANQFGATGNVLFPWRKADDIISSLGR